MELMTINELYGKVRVNPGEYVFAKAGSMVGAVGKVNYEKVMIGPQRGMASAIMGHIARRMTGENLPLMKVTAQSPAEVYLADNAKHVTVITLNPGEDIKVESEDLLAFTPNTDYGVTFLAQGVLSQKGFCTTHIKGKQGMGFVAITTDGNPMVIPTPCQVDPDAVVAWTGPNPGLGTNLNWKTFIGQTSGESYSFEFKQPGYQVIIQPNERKSGLHLGVDDNRYTPTTQNNQGMGDAMGEIGDALGGLGRIFR